MISGTYQTTGTQQLPVHQPESHIRTNITKIVYDDSNRSKRMNDVKAHVL